MHAGGFICTHWLSALCLAAGVLGCSQPTDTPPPPAPEPVSAAGGNEALIDRVREAAAPGGDTWAMWVERQLAKRGGRVVFCDWHASGDSVRFTYVVRGDDDRITRHAYQWILNPGSQAIPSPRHLDLLREADIP